MTHWFVVVFSVLVVGCAGAPGAMGGDISVTVADEPIAIRDTGAVIVDKRHVATLDESGKLTDSKGALLAFVHDDRVVLRGGATIAFKATGQKSLRLSQSAQRDAGLEPVEYWAHPDGRLSRTEDAEGGIEIKGSHDPKARRALLVIMLLVQNKRL